MIPATALLLAAALGGEEARADSLEAARSQPLVEVAHSVDVKIVDGVARYTVRRTFANGGVQADEAAVRIHLPPGAAATGLRIRARDRWYRGDLMEAEEAREKYRELTGLGAWEPKDPALLQWVWADRLQLQVFPVLAGGANTVEYTLTAPLHYIQGKYVVAYPRAEAAGRGGEGDEGGAAMALPVIRVHPGHGDAATAIRVDGLRAVADVPVVLGPPREAPWRGDGEPVEGASYVHSRLAVEGMGTARAARVEVAIEHTYRGDLGIELVTPGGRRLPVTRGQGGENDLRGTFEVELPAKTTIGGDWYLSVSDHAGLDVGTLEAWSLAFDMRAPKATGAPTWTRPSPALDTPLFIPDARSDDDAGLARIEVEAPPIDVVAARLGRVVASEESSFSRVEIDVAPQLRPLPRRASVVFVVDASRSLTAAEILRQVEVARAYVAHVDDAAVEIVAFRRRAERVFGDFIPATELTEAIASGGHRRLLPGNGSAIDEGLRLAGELLRDRPGPRRIVVLSDARLRSSFRAEVGVAAAKVAPAGTITHVVIPEEGREVALVRDDAHALASLPASRGGVLYHLEVPGETTTKALSAGILGLVRPIALENLTIEGAAAGVEVPGTLREGDGFRAMVKAASAPRQIVIRGMLWGEVVRREVRATRAFSEATAAFVFSEDEHHRLSEAEMMRVALFGRAVSPVTSYLATEPGVRPSLIGLELVGVGRGGGGSGEGLIGLGNTGLLGRGHAPTLEALVAPGVAACKAKTRPRAGWTLELAVETTSVEIVDVIPAHPLADPLDACVVEAVWDTVLTWNFTEERALRPLRLG
ncbi:MAG: proprotein convertase P-domain-containing protein [Myxococcales bacterium]|nr:proprotein convertase P-domain-containing protein [Myxococcales bacterium]